MASWIAAAGLAGLLVVVLLVPSDSIEVEQGGALPLVPLAVLAWAAAALSVSDHSASARTFRSERILHGLVWVLAGWIAIAAVAVADVGNLRQAVNEAWWWIVAAATFTAARWSLTSRHGSLASIVLLVSLASGLAVQAAHQQWVTLPADRAAYEADPEGALQEIGLFAPPGSPERALFESRLYGGGPTATFALTNSLAAVLLIGIVLAGGILSEAVRSRRGESEGAQRWRVGGAAAVAALLCGIALLWTESRSAFVGLAVAGGFAAVVWCCRWRSLSKPMLVGVAAAAVVVGLGILSLLLRPGLLAGAPRSLRYRFEYWQATLDLVADHPWFGAGPGNFQERYVTYRLDQASEAVADPHNWLVETLATGGVPALVLLLATIGVGLKIAAGRRRPVLHDAAPAPRWAMSAGAVLGFMGVLLAWISQAYLPNFDALLLSLIVVVAVSLTLYPLVAWGSSLSEPNGGRIAAAAAVAVAVHLLAAGGWTVPGVAAPWLVLLAIALGPPAAGSAELPPAGAARFGQPRWRGAWVGGVAVVLLGAWWGTAWLPVQRAAEHLEQGDFAIATGRSQIAAAAYQDAAEADPWNPLPLIRRADVFRWAIVRQADSPATRDQWSKAWEGAIARNPAAAGLWLNRAVHRLHFFQRWGDRDDLEEARQDLLAAVARDRSNVTIAAQLAVVEAALENREAAETWQARAETLAAAGDHADRQLSVVQVLPAESIGERAEPGAWRVAAAERLGGSHREHRGHGDGGG
ncbi:O-antigen ligase family protein [Candidatus Laterigemmans baculatus]|uniref:O-antigen ligase family protein n=1 Tax=Candidatus Laterigemmans baculatus TaxID=2770505 RepID=UPI0013DCF8B1|nr:O-antigen ligase family protein [Candidatus Laterigemmans baculatus]